MENLIELRYQFKQYQNLVLRKFFKTKEQVDSFKDQHPNYVYLN